MNTMIMNVENSLNSGFEGTSEPLQFQPSLALENLLAALNFREKEIVLARYGLQGKGEKKTLQDIGKEFGITRERVRQIESGCIKRLQIHPEKDVHLAFFRNHLQDILDAHGGIMEENHLCDALYGCVSTPEQRERAAIVFILEVILKRAFEIVAENEHHKTAWKIPGHDHSHVSFTCPHIESILIACGDTCAIEHIHEQLHRHESFMQNPISAEKTLAYLHMGKKFKRDVFGKWGLSHWASVSPKKTNDKIHIVLKREGKPMHFKRIAQRINEIGFDAKVAYPATVHNELILDEKYVLIGRGIYALSEWGYKRGVVADVIMDIIKTAAAPLTKEEIIAEVLKQRLVGKTTVLLALMNKSRFKKNQDGKYSLA